MELLPKAGGQGHSGKDILYEGRDNSIWAQDLQATRLLCPCGPIIFKYIFPFHFLFSLPSLPLSVSVPVSLFLPSLPLTH